MINDILDILHSNKIDKFVITDEIRESSELFFVKKQLDLTRAKKVHEVSLTVYHEFEKDKKHYLGSSEVFLSPNDTKEILQKKILSAWELGAYVENPYFELPTGQKNEMQVVETNLNSMDLIEAAKEMAKALYSEDIEKDAFVNSSEFFATKKTVRIINSSGCDVSYTKYGIDGEFVVQSNTLGKDVELHLQFEYDNLDTEAIKIKCREALHSVRDRALAEPAPKDLTGIPIILCDGAVGEFLDFYLQRANASNIYPGYSPFCEGYEICSECNKEKLNLTMVPDVPYSRDGVKMEKKIFIEDGIVKALHGRASYSSYINIPQAGLFTGIECGNGTVSLEEMKKTPYLMIKSFSDFQVDAMDGYFGGEFRLGYLFDGQKETIITGGTVSGNIFEAQKNLEFSVERYRDAKYSGPAAVKIY